MYQFYCRDYGIVIGYSGFNVSNYRYEYNESSCFIGDSVELIKYFMENCGYSSSGYRIVPITFSDVMNNYGKSYGEYAMESQVCSRFMEIAKKYNIKFSKKKFDATLTHISINTDMLNTRWNIKRALNLCSRILRFLKFHFLKVSFSS